MGRRGLLATVITAAVLLTGSGVRAATVPSTTWRQDTGQTVVAVPPTHSCAETLVTDYPFVNTAYGPDHNFTGTYTPPAGCPGPWAKVVLTIAVHVSGTQFDRTGDVQIGGVEVLRTSTEEPPIAGTVTWTFSKDITQYASLLTSSQPVTFGIGNVVTGPYNGIYYGSLRLTFHAADATHAAPPVADVVLGGAQRYVDSPAQHVDLTTPMPQNLVRLQAEMFADGHGACDEFWWTEVPGASSCGGAPYREVAVRVDGRLAGVAPVFPDVFTGADGPDYWHPIPAPRAFDLRPYVADLTPFAGLLTDGAPHTVSVSVVDWTQHSGDNWFVGVNLLAWTNHASTARTTGTLLRDDAPPTSTDTAAGGPTGAVASRFTASHRLTIAGTESIPGAGDRTTTVTEQLNETAAQTVPVSDVWTWTNRTTTAPAGAAPTVETLSARYSIMTDVARFAIGDAYSDTTTVAGRVTHWVRLADSMTTAAEFPGIVGTGGSSAESWRFSDSGGLCVDHELRAAAQVLLLDSVRHSRCATAVPLPA